MPTVRSVTEIGAPTERCFDLARSIGFHVRPIRDTGERAAGGAASGLIALDEEVMWEARRLGVRS